MTNQDMINSITNSLQTTSNINLLVQQLITQSLSTLTTEQLQQYCTILGINYNN